LILHSISYLDEVEEHYENLHLQFMIQLAAFLGFSPGSVQDIMEEIRMNLTEEVKKQIMGSYDGKSRSVYSNQQSKQATYFRLPDSLLFHSRRKILEP